LENAPNLNTSERLSSNDSIFQKKSWKKTIGISPPIIDRFRGCPASQAFAGRMAWKIGGSFGVRPEGHEGWAGVDARLNF